MGVSEALYIPAGLALIADYHRGNTRSLAVGIHMTGLYVGQALGGFGATVADTWSWQIAFHSFGLIGIAYSVILVMFLHENRVDETQQSDIKVFRQRFQFSGQKPGLIAGYDQLLGDPFLFCCSKFSGMGDKELASDAFFRYA